jgi:hypothetical protein
MDAEDLDHAAVDAALARLRGPTSAEDRFNVLQQLVRYWHGPIEPEDGMKQEELKGFRLPRPLVRWYEWAGNREEIMSGQNFLFAPREDCYEFRKLRIEDNRLLFYIENQAVYQWATLPEGDDPPVFGHHNDSDSWQPEGITLTEHLIAACLVEAILCHSAFYACAAWLKEEKLNQIVGQTPQVSIGGWRWPGPTRFHAAKGAFLYVCENPVRGELGYCLWAGAKTEKPLQFLKPYVDESWESVEL